MRSGQLGRRNALPIMTAGKSFNTFRLFEFVNAQAVSPQLKNIPCFTGKAADVMSPLIVNSRFQDSRVQKKPNLITHQKQKKKKIQPSFFKENLSSKLLRFKEEKKSVSSVKQRVKRGCCFLFL